MKVDGFVKSPFNVIPAKAGIQKRLKTLDSGLRRNDESSGFRTFYEFINFDLSSFWKLTQQMLLWVSLLLLLAAPAHAHKVTVFAWVENGTVHTESKFGGGRPVVQGRIEVFDPQGRRVLEGTTDDQGLLSFDLPQPGDLKIVLNAGMGHGNHWWLRAADNAAGDPNPISDEAAAARKPNEAEAIIPAECPDAGEVRQIVLQALDTRLAPLEARLAEQRPPWRDIAAGIGYILGLMGVAVIIRNTKNKERSKGA
jgi:nickel transport protein